MSSIVAPIYANFYSALIILWSWTECLDCANCSLLVLVTKSRYLLFVTRFSLPADRRMLQVAKLLRYTANISLLKPCYLLLPLCCFLCANHCSLLFDSCVWLQNSYFFRSMLLAFHYLLNTARYSLLAAHNSPFDSGCFSFCPMIAAPFTRIAARRSSWLNICYSLFAVHCYLVAICCSVSHVFLLFEAFSFMFSVLYRRIGSRFWVLVSRCSLLAAHFVVLVLCSPLATFNLLIRCSLHST